MRTAIRGVVVAVAVAFAVSLVESRVEAGSDAEASRPEFYTQKVKPILMANCYRCHAGMFHRGGLNLASRAGMLKGGKDGVVVLPGDPAGSLLVKLIRHEGPSKDPGPMPPKSKLSDGDISTVERWVKAGAIMPPDAPAP